MPRGYKILSFTGMGVEILFGACFVISFATAEDLPPGATFPKKDPSEFQLLLQRLDATEFTARRAVLHDWVTSKGAAPTSEDMLWQFYMYIDHERNLLRDATTPEAQAHAKAAEGPVISPLFASMIGIYRLDVDTYVKLNKALDFSLWTKGTEEQVRAEVSEQIAKIRVVLAEKRMGESTEAGIAKGDTVGSFIKSIDNDGDNACMVMTYTISPSGEESHRYFRFYKKADKLFMTKTLLGQEVVYPLVKVEK